MKRQGETESNPRFQQLNNQLMAIQRAQTLKTQQQQQQLQQQQLQQQSPQQQTRPQDGQSGPGQQSSPVMNVPSRPLENGQMNGIIYRRPKAKSRRTSP